MCDKTIVRELLLDINQKLKKYIGEKLEADIALGDDVYRDKVQQLLEDSEYDDILSVRYGINQIDMFFQIPTGNRKRKGVMDLSISLKVDKRFRYQLVGTVKNIEINLKEDYKNMYDRTIEELRLAVMKNYKKEQLVSINEELQKLDQKRQSLQSELYDFACWDI